MKNKHSKGFIRPSYPQLNGLSRALDDILIFIALYISLQLYHIPLNLEYMTVCFICIFLFSLFAEGQELYHGWRGSTLFDEALQILLLWFGTLALILTGIYISSSSGEFSRDVIELWLPLAPLFMIATHTAKRWAMITLRIYGYNARNYAILGANNLGCRLNNALMEMPWLGYRFIGFFDDRIDSADNRCDLNARPLVGCFNDLLDMAKKGGIDHIYITLPLCAEERISLLIHELADSTVSINIVPDFFIFNLIQSKWSNVQGIPVVGVFDTPLNSSNGVLKRIEDLLLCAVILPMITPIMLIIAIAIKKTSPGPIIFKQKRYGINGEQIEVWKFRSMTVCENGDTVTQATANDRRVTKLGAFLRKTSLDELPQFLNVLQGTMSVVGPRPHAVSHNEYYRKQIQDYMLRHKVKPGITGQAQINGCRGETDTIEKMEARVHHDLDYLRHWSLWLDIKIVFLTIFKGFVGKNVY